MEQMIKKLDYQPNALTRHEINNPLTVITEFFDNNELHEIREKLWSLSFYTHLINVVNAGYIYTENQKNAL